MKGFKIIGGLFAGLLTVALAQDAGNPCTDNDDCTGSCVTVIGVCNGIAPGSQDLRDFCNVDADCASAMCTVYSGTTGLCVQSCTDSDECTPDACCGTGGFCSVFDEESRNTNRGCFDDCECVSGECDMTGDPVFGAGTCDAPSPVPAPSPTGVVNDPHIIGLQGQDIEFHGVEAGWYALYTDETMDFQVNVRPTAPLPDLFPERQYISGLAILIEGHSIVIDVRDPHTVETPGCPQGVSPCLADGGVRVRVDGEEMDGLMSPTRNEEVADGMELSSANLPRECREFGGARAWARIEEKMQLQKRRLGFADFEEWLLSFKNMASPEWCAKFVAERGLHGVQSKQAVFRIVTPALVVRFSLGVNHRRGGKMDKLGRSLPALDFWQGAVGLEGVPETNEHISGMVGETGCPVQDEHGVPIMEGVEALRGSVSDYLVDGPLGTQFSLVHEDCSTL